MIEIQYSYKHISNDELVQKSLDNFQYDLKGDPSKVKKLSIYVKPQEDKAYYVVDDKISGDIDIWWEVCDSWVYDSYVYSGQTYEGWCIDSS